MSRILFATWDGGGNLPPALALAGDLQARGHNIRVMGHESQAAQVQNSPLPFIEYRTARPFHSTDANGLLGFSAMFSDRGIGRDVIAELQREPADLVVLDCMIFGAIEAVARKGIPYLLLEHTYDAYYAKKWLRGPIGLSFALKRMNVPKLLDGAAARIVATLEELDPAAKADRPANVRYVGPAVTGVPSTPAEPLVLVSLSTVNFHGQSHTLQRILDALADVPARAIVTTGPALTVSDLRAPANVELRDFVPHADLMPRASLVVGHGGHATTMQALAHDLPLIVMPMHPMLDQKMIGKSVEAAGAGLLLSKTAKPEQIARAIRRLLPNGPSRTAAARLGQAIRDSHGTRTGADLVEEIAVSVDVGPQQVGHRPVAERDT